MKLLKLNIIKTEFNDIPKTISLIDFCDYVYKEDGNRCEK